MMSKTGPNGQRLPSGIFWSGRSYYVAYRVEGKVKLKRIGPKIREAIRALEIIHVQVRKGEYSTMRDIVFEELAGQFLEEKATQGLRPSTMVSWETHIRRGLLPTLGQRKLKTIKKPDIIALLKGWLDRGMSPATACKYLVTTKSIFKKGVEDGYLGRNPAANVRAPKHTVPEVELLTSDQVKQLLQEATGQPRLMVLTALLSGVRAGELCGLQWGDIDLVEGKLSVRRVFTKGRYEKPKTASSRRDVSIPPQLVDALARAKPENAGDDSLVFRNARGNPVAWNNFLKRDWARLLEAADLPKVKFHGLRHNFVSVMLAAGEDLTFIQAQVGHVDLTTTLNVYSHLLPEKEKGAGLRIGEAFTSYVE